MSCPCQSDIDALNVGLNKIGAQIANINAPSLNLTLIGSQQANLVANINTASNIVYGNTSLYNLNISNLLTIGNTVVANNNNGIKKISLGGTTLSPTDPIVIYGNANIAGNLSIRDRGLVSRIQATDIFAKSVGVAGVSYPTFGAAQRTYLTGNIWGSYTGASTNTWTSVCWCPEYGYFCAVGNASPSRVMLSQNPTVRSWTSYIAAPDSASWQSVCWSPELSLFCAVGRGGVIMTSTAGTSWTAGTGPSGGAGTNDWMSVCWSPDLNLFCVVSETGTGNRVMTSQDGVTWTARMSAEDNAWSSVCWSPDLAIFCAVAYSGTNRVMTSPDGLTWTAQSAPAQTWYSVCWSSQLRLFCSVASSGTGNRVITSSDGVTWTNRTSSADNSWTSVCWAPEIGLFWATAISGTLTRFMSSPDGIVWTTRTSPSGDANRYCVAWSPEISLFVAPSGTGAATSIPAGIQPMLSYGNINTINTDLMLRPVTGTYAAYYNSYYNRLGVATTTPSNANVVVNGRLSTGWGINNTLYNTTQTDVTHIYFNAQSQWKLRSIFAGGVNYSMILSCINGNSFIVTSGTDVGKTLAVSHSTNPNNFGITVNGNINVIHGGATHSSNTTVGRNLYYTGSNVFSANLASNRVGIQKSFGNITQALDMIGDANIAGNLWIQGNITTGSYYLYDVYSQGYKTAPMRTGGPQKIYLETGPWLSYSLPTSLTWTSITWSPTLGLFCAVASDGVSNGVATSPDGVTWVGRTPAANSAWNSVTWSRELGLFCAVSTGGAIMTSPNGTTWTSRTVPVAGQSLTSVTWSRELGLFVAVASSGTGTGNRVITSLDGVTWTSRTSPADLSWTSICWASELFLFVAVASSGTGNRVMTSSDGVTWTAGTSAVDNDWQSVVWAPELALFVAVSNTGSSNRVMTSSTGTDTWTTQTTSNDNYTSLSWSPEVGLFVVTSSTTNIMTSRTGTSWTTRAVPIAGSSVAWSGAQGVFVTVGSSGSTLSKTMWGTPLNKYLSTFAGLGNLNVDNKTLFIDYTSNRVGILTNTPAYALEVNGTAGKTGGGTWSAPSDARIKEEIVSANLEICEESIQKIPLKRFRWANVVPTSMEDTHQLGWIAQDIQKVFPKSVREVSRYGYDDFLDMDAELLWKSMYGALKKNIMDIEDLERRSQKLSQLIGLLVG